MLFVGDNWAEDHHDIELINDSGRRLARARLPESVQGVSPVGGPSQQDRKQHGPVISTKLAVSFQRKADACGSKITAQNTESDTILTITLVSKEDQRGTPHCRVSMPPVAEVSRPPVESRRQLLPLTSPGI